MKKLHLEQLEQLQKLKLNLLQKVSLLQSKLPLKKQQHQQQCTYVCMYVNYLRNKCFSTSTQTTEEATTTTQETTTEQPTTIITTTEHDIPESYEGRTIILLNTKKQTLFHLGSIPLWIILLISICMVILTILAICVFLKRFQPDVWNSLKRRCPELNRQNNYQVSSLNSCKSKFGLIKRCIPSCPEVLKFKWFQRGKTDPSRDTCFLCLKKVIENNFD